MMSRAQAVIVCEGSRFVLRDLNSTNGTLVNGNPVTEIDLHPGDSSRWARCSWSSSEGRRNDRRPPADPNGPWARRLARPLSLAMYFVYVDAVRPTARAAGP